MDLAKFIFTCILLVPLASATYYYRRPIAYSKIDPKFSERSQLSHRHDTGKASSQTSSPLKKETSHENKDESNGLPQGPIGLPLYSSVYLVPVKDELAGHNNDANGGVFGAYGSLIIPGLNFNLLGSTGFGGSLSASGGFAGHYGPSQGGHSGGGGNGFHAGEITGSLITPVQYVYPVSNVGGIVYPGAHQGFSSYYAGAGIHHKESENPSSAGVVSSTPIRPTLGGNLHQKGNDNQLKQVEVLLELPSYQQEGEGFEQSVLPPGFHRPGFIASSAGRLGYPVLMASPEQLQDIALRQSPNPVVQFLQRPIQFIQMLVRPQNQGSSNSSKEPEKPGVESAVAGKPSSEKPAGSQSHSSGTTVDKEQGDKQNTAAPASPQKKPIESSESEVDNNKDKREEQKPEPAAPEVSDIVASVNEVVKATTVNNAGSAPVLPVLVEENSSKARAAEDIKFTLDSAAEEVTDASANVVPNDESPVDIESKPIA